MDRGRSKTQPKGRYSSETSVQNNIYIDLGRFFLDLSKLTYAGLVLVAFAACVLERKIGILEFAVIAVVATFIGSLFVWLGTRFLKKGHMQEEERL